MTFPGEHTEAGIALPRGIIESSNGELYGTLEETPPADGAIFKLTLGGSLAFLHQLSVATVGGEPLDGLILASDGNFYGTTSEGGSNSYGTVFRMTQTGEMMVLHSFSGADGSPWATPIQASDGNLYGTSIGGLGLYGSVYRLSLNGEFTVLHSFDLYDGANPEGRLYQATNGELYGTTSDQFFNGNGTVFKISLDGEFTTLHRFTGADGSDPTRGALVQASDGFLYGVTFSGGAAGYGTAFHMTLAGQLATIHNFAGLDGRNPLCTLLVGADGMLYGTGSSGGIGDSGTVFSMNSTGAIKVLYSFDGTDGDEPEGALIQAGSGDLYGITYRGGKFGGGTVFRLALAAK